MITIIRTRAILESMATKKVLWEEEAGQADAQPEFTEMPFGDSDL